MFRLIEPSSGQIQNIVLGHSVSADMCALTECTSTMFCICPDGGSISRNMSPNF